MDQEGGFLKTALITGVSSLMGEDLCRSLLERSYKVLGTSRNASALRFDEGDFAGWDFDLQDEVDIEKFTARFAGQFQRLDLVVHFVGGLVQTERFRWPEMTYEDWLRSYQVNTLAPVFVTQKLHGLLSPGAKVFFIGSYAAHHPGESHPEYVASKAALAGAARYFQKQWASDGISVTCLEPRFVRSRAPTTGVGEVLLAPEEFNRNILDRLDEGDNGRN